MWSVFVEWQGSLKQEKNGDKVNTKRHETNLIIALDPKNAIFLVASQLRTYYMSSLFVPKQVNGSSSTEQQKIELFAYRTLEVDKIE